MVTTKKTLAEQVQRIYARYVDRENIEPVIYKQEVELAVGQAINFVLQAKTMEQQRLGGAEIPQSSLVKYESVSVTGNKLTLPAFPLDLEDDMGVWEISDPASPLNVYIPVPLQVAKVFQGTLSENLEGQIGYYRYGDTVYFLSTPASAVDVFLLVSDLDQLNDNDPLPLARGYEIEVIKTALELLGIPAGFAPNELNSVNNRMDALSNQLTEEIRRSQDTDGISEKIEDMKKALQLEIRNSQDTDGIMDRLDEMERSMKIQARQGLTTDGIMERLDELERSINIQARKGMRTDGTKNEPEQTQQ